MECQRNYPDEEGTKVFQIHEPDSHKSEVRGTTPMKRGPKSDEQSSSSKLACFSHHIGPAMWKPATWEADTGLARPGLVTDAGGQGSRLGFPSRKASLGIPLPRREAEPRKNIWRILFFSCAAAGPTAGHES